MDGVVLALRITCAAAASPSCGVIVLRTRGRGWSQRAKFCRGKRAVCWFAAAVVRVSVMSRLEWERPHLVQFLDEFQLKEEVPLLNWLPCGASGMAEYKVM